MYHSSMNGILLLMYVLLVIFGPVTLVAGIALMRLRQPHAPLVLGMGIALTGVLVYSAVRSLLGLA